MFPLLPVSASSGSGQSIVRNAVESPYKPLHKVVEDTKGCKTGQALDGSSRGLDTASMSTEGV